MKDRETVIEALQYMISENCTETQFDYTDDIEAAIALLKEQEEQIKNRDESLEKAREEIKWLRGMLKEQEKQIKNRNESLEKAREEIKWLRGMLKEQEAVEGTIEETRGEWPDETLPVSRNKEREYPCDHSRRDKA